MDKRCKHCGELKPLVDFYADAGAKDGRRPECKMCTAARRKRWYEANRSREIARVKAWQDANSERHLANQRARRARPEVKAKDRAGHLRRKFGITPEEYDAMLAAQGGGCAICKKSPRDDISLHVDHDHVTGRVRALCCFDCNAGLGKFGEDIARLRAAISYLYEHRLIEILLSA
ncbi:MAG: hypothetical protein JWO68_3161 [Actinomycetia bacterium]|nr:hypothetical protein [Actinomycetes bacterium]